MGKNIRNCSEFQIKETKSFHAQKMWKSRNKSNGLKIFKPYNWLPFFSVCVLHINKLLKIEQ